MEYHMVIMGLLPFNIYINDLFLISNRAKICRYADDTILFDCNKNLKDLVINLEYDSAIAISYFNYNYMEVNEEQFRLQVTGHK